MKKNIFMSVLCAGLLASCSSNEPFADGDNTTEAKGNQFITLSLVPGSVTRADGDYEDGTEAENKVNAVRFYFFTASGAPAMVKADAENDGVYQSYYDWTPVVDVEDPDTDNVSEVLQATIIIDSAGDKDLVPYSVIAILNPDEDLPSSNMSIADLDEVMKQYNTAGFTAAGKFLMSNSAYLNESGVEIEAVPVRDHIYSTKELAIGDPVIIHVERVVAKMNFVLSSSLKPVNNIANVYDTGVKYDVEAIAVPTDKNDYTGNICVKFLGWNVTATPNKSRMMKSIDALWPTGLFGNQEVWNNPARFRSFWAINPENVTYAYGNFGVDLPGATGTYTPTGNTANKNGFAAPGAAASIYMEENAAMYNNDGFCAPYDNSKVIIAAQLVQDDGVTPITLAEWGFNYYTVNGLKTVFANEAGVYKMTTQGEGADAKTIYTKITYNDITFVPAATIDPTVDDYDEGNTGRYYVYPQLVKEANTKYTLSNAEGTQPVDYTVANNVIQKLGKAKVWNGGYTYYYFDIEHLGAPNMPGYLGVVRNHIYQSTITKVTGLGTPVYDPSLTIYPEKPVNEESMIAAQIKVLTWRWVKKNVELSW